MKQRKVSYLLVIAILIIGLVILVYQVGKNQLLRKRAAGGTATIILTPNANTPVTVTNGGTFNVIVSLNPNNNALVGADVFLTFPTNLLNVTNIQIPSTFTNNTLHTYAPVKTDGSGAFDNASVISKANATGNLEFGAVAFDYNPSPGQVLAPQSTAVSPFATITFTSKATGTGQVKIKFTSGSTIDSNLVSNSSGTPSDVISDGTATSLDSTVNFTVSSGVTPTPTLVSTPTPTSISTAGSLSFQIKFQGVSTATANKNVTVVLRQGTDVPYTVAVTANSLGVYSGVLTGITPGSYDVLIKGPVHLRKKMTSAPIVIASGTNSFNWSSTPLLTGDVNNDNKVDSSDYALLLIKYNPGVTISTIEDINFDSKVDSTDYSLLLFNYNPTVTGN